MPNEPVDHDARPPASGRRRLAYRLAGSASLVGLTMLGASAGSGDPPEPLIPGGQLTAGLAAVAQVEPLSMELSLAAPRDAGYPREAEPVEPAEPREKAAAEPLQPPPPVALSAPLPPPRKPTGAARIAWIPALKPLPVQSAALAASAPPTIWPAPPKPGVVQLAQAVEPAAGPPDDRLAGPGPERITITRDLRERPGLGAAIAVSQQDDLLPQLDRAAREALLAGDATTALQLYERASALFPAERSALLGRALALQRLGRRSEAQALYQVLLEADASDLGARIALLGVLAERAPGEALQLLGRLVRHHPTDGRLPAQIAMVLARQGDLAGALAAQRRAVTLAPADLGHRVNLAVLQDRAGHADAAIEAYQHALELATLGGVPTVQLDAIAARLQHLRQQQQTRSVPALAPR